MKIYRIIVILFMITSSLVLSQENLNRDICRQLALNYNQDVKSANLETQSATAIKEASGKDYLPRLDFSANYSYFGKPMVVPNVVTMQQNQYNVNATVFQEVYTGGRVSSLFDMNESIENIARENIRYTEAELIFATDNSYWKTVSDFENLFVAQRYLGTIEKLFKVINDKVNAEVVSKNDLLITEVRLNDAKLSVLESSNRLAISKMELNRLIGYPITKPITIEDVVPLDVDGIDFEALIERAVKQRPEIKMQLQKVEASKFNADLTSSVYLPQVYVGANGTWGVPAPELGADADFNYSLFGSVSFPIFLWGKSSLEVQSQELLTNSEQEQYQKIEEIVTLEVESSKYSFDEADKRVELTLNSLKRASENLEIMTTRYLEGLSPILEVLDAQVFWLKAYLDHINAKRIYQVSYSALLKSVGELNIANE